MSASSPPRRPSGVAVVLVSIGVLGFLVFLARAVALYPGGTFCHEGSPGFDLVANYFCDLTHPRALDGASNALSVRSMRAAMFALGVAVFAFFQLDARAVTRVTGSICGIAVPLVALFPSSVDARMHAVVVFAAAIPGLIAAALAFRTAWSLSRARRVVASLALGSAIVTTLLYVQILVWNDPCAVGLPVAQKIAAALFVVWMVTTARSAVPAR